MKKVIKQIIIFLILMTTVPGIAYNYHSNSSQETQLKGMVQYEDFFYSDIEDDKINPAITAIKNDVINKIPTGVQDSLKKSNWVICIVNDINQLYKDNTMYVPDGDNYHLEGLTISMPRMIIIKYTDNMDELKKVVSHEIGHAIDYEYGLISNSREFSEIYRKEIDKINISEYCKNSNEECFAELFKEHLLNNSLSEQSSKTESFFQDLLQQPTIKNDNSVNKIIKSVFGGYRLMGAKLKNIAKQAQS